MGGNQSQLKKEDLDDLQKETHFQGKELKSMYKQFKKENPQSVISRDEFIDVLQQMGISDPVLQDMIFRGVDAKNQGVLTFQDVAVALSIMTRGTTDEKLQFAFSMYDLGKTGYITKDGMTQVVTAFFNLVGPQVTLSGKKYDSPKDLVDEFFQIVDLDRDDRISLQEYKKGAQNHPDIIQGLQLWDS
mmetsp:Transcript_18281/g.51603  ORF Transcript_18281/g.51603 Transcript_18281/m.51603 type:complete len:188 (-) Transcript_18281:212-775(-)|eukprot:CAMPEP_0119133738 /NCGR_PEP_ID=MMETSP1310-20130426/13531_1 /TAXON_ID=464262 /ORGANISM="Genus nov. species nov., Strain RCC2339" /LENGTH=187 /DNA_ID=CAMNT_0007124439 /DNA_START=131 /DNA_END=697 /DNA_ORIENTATION=-